jgi:hypothetical protein
MAKFFDLGKILMGADSQPIRTSETTVARYKDFAISSLIAAYEGETLSYEAKFFRVILAEKLKPEGPVFLSFAEAMLIVELVSRFIPSPIITTRYMDMFDFTPDPVVEETPTLSGGPEEPASKKSRNSN